MEKINIAELLSDCPKGMELYSPIFGKVFLDKIRPHLAIVVTTDKEQGNFKEEFFYDGRYRMNGECMLFPSKDKTTWDGFHRPFKAGDILFVDCGEEEKDKSYQYIFILNSPKIYGKWYSHCLLNGVGDFYSYETYLTDNKYHPRFATEAEKQKLFDAIKANGYRWNEETKTLDKLINKNKFVVGATITNGIITGKIISRDVDSYQLEDGNYVFFNEVHNFELVPNKFDITTLKPFDKVLVRDTKEQVWVADLFSHMVNRPLGEYIFACVGHYPSQCIPYEGNEHLLGTTNDCDKFFKVWEE